MCDRCVVVARWTAGHELTLLRLEKFPMQPRDKMTARTQTVHCDRSGGKTNKQTRLRLQALGFSHGKGPRECKRELRRVRPRSDPWCNDSSGTEHDLESQSMYAETASSYKAARSHDRQVSENPQYGSKANTLVKSRSTRAMGKGRLGRPKAPCRRSDEASKEIE
jgi:hypothetical protein